MNATERELRHLIRSLCERVSNLEEAKEALYEAQLVERVKRLEILRVADWDPNPGLEGDM